MFFRVRQRFFKIEAQMHPPPGLKKCHHFILYAQSAEYKLT